MGIITAIIGAVRIGGPGWLRAIVGRARENLATAEVELTTSTSSNACELWNGQAIVRLPGAPKIVEFIYFPLPKDEGGAQGVKLYTVDTAKEKLHKDERKQWVGSFIAPRPPARPGTTTHKRRSLPHTDAESQRSDSSARAKTSCEAPNPQPITSAPNISLNLSPTRNKRELRLFALIGVLLQSGVIVFSGCAAYSPPARSDDRGPEEPTLRISSRGSWYGSLGRQDADMFVCGGSEYSGNSVEDERAPVPHHVVTASGKRQRPSL